MTAKYRVVRYVKTCPACPAQWEGTLDDGRMIYARYRHSELRVMISVGPTTNVDDVLCEGRVVFLWTNPDHPDHGEMTEVGLICRTVNVIHWGGFEPGPYSTSMDFGKEKPLPKRLAVPRSPDPEIRAIGDRATADLLKGAAT